MREPEIYNGKQVNLIGDRNRRKLHLQSCLLSETTVLV